MNRSFYFFAIFLFLNTSILNSQIVTTLANVTANGGVTLDAEGNLYVAHFGPLPITPGLEGKNIYKITPDGNVSTFVEDQLNVGSGNHIDSQGLLYQSNYQGNVIYQINQLGDIINSSFANIAGPVGITVIENDTLVVCECNTNNVKKIAADGSISTFATGSAFNCANGITQDDFGNLYTTNFSDGRITKITPQGNVTTLGTSSMAGNGHITFRSSDQHFYIASYGSNRIFKMDMEGTSTLFAGTGLPGTINSDDPLTATFNKPNGIEISHDGCSLYITQDNDVIREIKFQDSECVTGIVEIFEEDDIRLYPNPSSETVYLENNSGLVFETVNIISYEGKELFGLVMDSSSVLDISSLKNGVYFIKLTTSDGFELIKKLNVE